MANACLLNIVFWWYSLGVIILTTFGVHIPFLILGGVLTHWLSGMLS